MIAAVTGGTGFIGRHLVKRLLDEGCHVKLLTRSPKPTPAIQPHPKLEPCKGDLTGNVLDLKAFLDGAEILYHCAGEIRDHSKMVATHVTGTQNLIAASDNNIQHWVQLSSVGAYGNSVHGDVTEQTPVHPSGVYETTKTQSDQLVLEAARSERFTCAILRPSIVFGPTMSNPSFFQLIDFVYKGFFFFIGKPGASANYIPVDNVVEALLLCGKHPEAHNQVFNLSDNCTIEALVSKIASELQKPIPKLRLPVRPLRWVVKILGRLPNFPLSETRIDALTNRSIYPITRITQKLGYAHMVSMDQAIEQMVKAWRQRWTEERI